MLDAGALVRFIHYTRDHVQSPKCPSYPNSPKSCILYHLLQKQFLKLVTGGVNRMSERLKHMKIYGEKNEDGCESFCFLGGPNVGKLAT